MTIGAIILAAGQSQRFGKDKRKAVMASGTSVLVSTIQSVSRHFSQTLVVLRHQETDYQARLQDALNHAPGIQFLRATDSAKGMAHSLANAIAYLETYPNAYSKDSREDSPKEHTDRWDAAAIFLGDMPYLKPDSIECLLDKARSNLPNRPIVIPIFKGNTGKGKPGHPVIFHRAYFKEMAQLTGDTGAKSIITAYPTRVINVPVDDRGVIQDIDRQEDLGAD